MREAGKLFGPNKNKINAKKTSRRRYVTQDRFYFQIYNKFTDEVTVYMGPENGRRFFSVENFHGKPNLGLWQDPKCDSVQGSTEGVTYHQFIGKNDTLKYLRKTMCRVTPLKYKSQWNLRIMITLSPYVRATRFLDVHTRVLCC